MNEWKNKSEAPEYDIAAPGPAELFESLRAFGYDLQTAIADVIDNSIAAHANNIWVDFLWDGAASRITIRDDGDGMTEAKLVQAMRPGSQNPRDTRHEDDLGRFGLGMKTASISQCRRLTVASRTKDGLHVRRWDLDYIAAQGNGEWRLLKGVSLLSAADVQLLDGKKSGTVLFWDHLDRVVGVVAEDDEGAQKHFRQNMDLVRDHLSMTFHRYLTGRGRLTIRLNGRALEPWDPFLEGETATEPLEEEVHQTEGIRVAIKPFVLPHHSKITAEVHALAAGPRGWNSHQGFYIYRNKRLLVAGDWLGLGMLKEEHFKLARIRVDLPNTADLLWQIDVKKSRATPPASLRKDLLRIARTARSRAVRLYRHRGKVLSRAYGDQQEFLWQNVLKHGKTFYKINREHALVKKVIDNSEDKGALRALLALVEQSVPAPLIVINNAERPDSLGVPFSDSLSDLKKTMDEVYRSFLEDGKTRQDAAHLLARSEPFQHHPEVLAAFLEAVHAEHQASRKKEPQ
jgi:hypothetical protein